MKGLICMFKGHVEETKIVFDIPTNPWLIRDECLRDGFVCTEWTECDRCGATLETEIVPATEERHDEYMRRFKRGEFL